MINAARRSALLLVALAASACSLTNTGDPNTAAQVGDERIPTATIDVQFEAISNSEAFQQQAQQDASGQLVAQAQSQLVTSSVRSAILNVVAERNDVQVSDADVDAAVEEIVTQVGGQEEFERRLAQQGVPERLFLQQVRDQEIQTALQEQVGGDGDFVAFIRDEIADVPIRVNPRYGAWNETSLDVQPSDPLAPAGEQAGAGQEQPANP